VVEAGCRCGWEQFTAGAADRILSIDRFGESGRGEEVAEHLGLTVENLRRIVEKSRRGVAV
jgi:transketolase